MYLRDKVERKIKTEKKTEEIFTVLQGDFEFASWPEKGLFVGNNAGCMKGTLRKWRGKSGKSVGREERGNRRRTRERIESADVALSKPNGQNGQPPSVMAQ